MDFKSGYTLTLILKITIVLQTAIPNSVAKFYEPSCYDGSTKCFTAAVQRALPIFVRGLPQYSIDSLDPFSIDKVDLTLAGGLEIEMRDGLARGLRKCVVDFVRLENDILESQFHCNLTVKTKYEAQGKLLLFTINADGDATTKIMNIKIHNVIKLGSRIGPDGRQYLVIKDSATDHSFDGRIMYHLTNIMKGSPEASQGILNFLNENWRMVADEFGSPFVEYGVSNVLKNVEKLFSVVSRDRLISGEF